ncbi:MAG: alpha/beta hydrolase, partial [Rubrivivax sp.]
MHGYRAPWWLPGGNLQTIWPALCSRPRLAEAPAYRRERWRAPDGDFIDVDHLDAATAAPGAPALVLFHGLESSSSSRYALAFAQVAQALGWHFSVPHFRGCSGELNHAPRAYHSGDFEEIAWMLGRLHERHHTPLLAAGVSLGGNALLRWAEEAGDS